MGNENHTHNGLKASWEDMESRLRLRMKNMDWGEKEADNLLAICRAVYAYGILETMRVLSDGQKPTQAAEDMMFVARIAKNMNLEKEEKKDAIHNY